jgi:hypothetical protein
MSTTWKTGKNQESPRPRCATTRAPRQSPQASTGYHESSRPRRATTRVPGLDGLSPPLSLDGLSVPPRQSPRPQGATTRVPQASTGHHESSRPRGATTTVPQASTGHRPGLDGLSVPPRALGLLGLDGCSVSPRVLSPTTRATVPKLDGPSVMNHEDPGPRRTTGSQSHIPRGSRSWRGPTTRAPDLDGSSVMNHRGPRGSRIWTRPRPGLSTGALSPTTRIAFRNEPQDEP